MDQGAPMSANLWTNLMICTPAVATKRIAGEGGDATSRAGGKAGRAEQEQGSSSGHYKRQEQEQGSGDGWVSVRRRATARQQGAGGESSSAGVAACPSVWSTIF